MLTLHRRWRYIYSIGQSLLLCGCKLQVGNFSSIQPQRGEETKIGAADLFQTIFSKVWNEAASKAKKESFISVSVTLSHSSLSPLSLLSLSSLALSPLSLLSKSPLFRLQLDISFPNWVKQILFHEKCRFYIFSFSSVSRKKKENDGLKFFPFSSNFEDFEPK